MIVVRLDWFSRIDGNRVEWFGTVHAAHRRVKALLNNDPEMVGPPKVQQVDLPRGKASAMVDWLNTNLRSANV